MRKLADWPVSSKIENFEKLGKKLKDENLELKTSEQNQRKKQQVAEALLLKLRKEKGTIADELSSSEKKFHKLDQNYNKLILT